MQELTILKSIPLLFSSFTTWIAIIIVAFRSPRDTGHFNHFVANNRDSLALAIQVASSLLCACQVFTIISLFTYWTRLQLQRNVVTLAKLQFWASISSLQIKAKLPLSLAVSLTLVALILKVPEALWAGALTLLFVPVNKISGTIKLPTYPLSSAKWWEGELQRNADGSVTTILDCLKNRDIQDTSTDTTGNIGFVSSCPAVDLLGNLTGSAGSTFPATLRRLVLRVRINNSSWTNIGRSYGVGAPPGFMDVDGLSEVGVPIHAFNYHEMGYKIQVSCSYNQFSNYSISYLGTVSDDLVQSVNILAAGRTLQNSISGHVEQYIVATIYPGGNLEALAWSAIANNDRNMIAVAGTDWYKYFDRAQCVVKLGPTDFSVKVNVTARTIEVHPLPDIKAIDIEPTATFTTNLLYALELVSRLAGSNVISSLCNPILYNAYLFGARDDSNGGIQGQNYLIGLEDSIAAILVNSFVAYAQSQLVLLKSSTTAVATAQLVASKLAGTTTSFPSSCLTR